MQVKYVQAAINGAAALQPQCRANFANPGPDPLQCLAKNSNIEQLLGYSQQRQAVQGRRFQIQGTDYIAQERSEVSSSTNRAESASQNGDVFPNLKELFKPVLSTAADMLPKQFRPQQTIDDIGEGIGLLWMTEDWSDTPGMPSGVKFHDSYTLSSSGIVLVNPDQQIGVVLLANFPGTNSLGFSPERLTYAPWTEWWCGAARAENGCD